MSAASSIDDVLATYRQHWGIPGVTAGVLHRGQVTLSADGEVNRRTGYPARPDTLFQIGSQTKAFTATLILQLVERGHVDLDAPLALYLPDLRLQDERATASITLRHVLTHTSGLEGDRLPATRLDDLSDEALSRVIAHYHLLQQVTPPGELWSYSNAAVLLAGAVIERVLQTSYENAMRERIFRPLGLEHTYWFAHEAIVCSAAVGHIHAPESGEPQVALPYLIPRGSNPSGGIISNVEDMLRFARFHLGEDTISDESVLTRHTRDVMQVPRVVAGARRRWGLGWEIRLVDGCRVIGHSGGTHGQYTSTILVPEHAFAFSVCTNSNQGEQLIQSLERWALERYCGIRDVDPVRILIEQAALKRFEGNYALPAIHVSLTRVDGVLRLTATTTNPLTGQTQTLPPMSLAAIGEAEFEIADGNWEGYTVEFIADSRDDQPRYARVVGRVLPRAT
jgi:CubicO group peptidase (beta-lactamase class C family)